MSEQQKKAQQEPDLNQLRKVRREKLADLQANGKDPFVITKYDQTHHSLEIKENFEELAGKDATFKCTVHTIKAKELPELDDEFASEVSE